MSFSISSLDAEILNRNTPPLRIRLGQNGGGVSTVIYNAGVPSSFAGVAGVTTDPLVTSTNGIAGGSGSFTVRILTDVNARPSRGTSAPTTGTFTYDSSNNLTCTTPATCGTEVVPTTKISWVPRDNDTLNTVTSYDGSASQVFQVQIDNNNANNQFQTRHRNFYRFSFTNDTLYPAGTYETTITANGEAVW